MHLGSKWLEWTQLQEHLRKVMQSKATPVKPTAASEITIMLYEHVGHKSKLHKSRIYKRLGGTILHRCFCVSAFSVRLCSLFRIFPNSLLLYGVFKAPTVSYNQRPLGIISRQKPPNRSHYKKLCEVSLKCISFICYIFLKCINSF